MSANARLAQLWQGVRFAEQAQPFPLIPAWIAIQASARPSARYLTFATKDGESGSLTFTEAEHLSGRLAGWLRHHGVLESGSPVALAPRNDERSVLTILALLRAGGLSLLLSPADPDDRQQQQIAAAGCASRLSLPGSPLPGGLDLPDPRLLTADCHWTPPFPAADTPAFLIGTSGSTAAAKVVLQVHANAAANAAALIAHHGLAPGLTLLGSLPIHHVNGLHFTLLATLAAGSHAVLVDGFDPFGYFGQLERYRPDLASVVPTVLESLLAFHRGRSLPDSLRYFVSAAAPLQASTAEQVLARLSRRVCQGYGLTETTNFACTVPPDLTDAGYRRRLIETEMPSVGVALAGNEVAILAPDGTILPPGESGEICMRGHNVMAGYWGNPSASEEAFAHGWFHSGDLGHTVVEPDCGRSFFVITGRSKNMAKIGGEAVSFEEVERCLRALPGVQDAAVGVIPDRFYGQKLLALVATDAEPDEAGLRAALVLRLPAIAIPARFVRVEQIPRTPTGKLQRPRIAELIAALDHSP